MLEEERAEHRLEQRGEDVAVLREPLDVLAFAEGREPPAEVELAATTAQLARETTCERIFASRPSENSG